jgi:multimeric flavodoxin WrbA
MKVFAIFGGPRINKNTDNLLKAYIKGMEGSNVELEITRMNLRDLNINYCTGCYACAKTGECIFEDDMQKVYEKLEESDIILLATPFYFNSVSSLTKTMIDRCQKYWTSKFVLKKKVINKKKSGILLVTSGAKQKGNEKLGAQLVADLFFKSIGAEFEKNIFVENTDETEFIERTSLLFDIEKLGEELVRKHL